MIEFVELFAATVVVVGVTKIPIASRSTPGVRIKHRTRLIAVQIGLATSVLKTAYAALSPAAAVNVVNQVTQILTTPRTRVTVSARAMVMLVPTDLSARSVVTETVLLQLTIPAPFDGVVNPRNKLAQEKMKSSAARRTGIAAKPEERPTAATAVPRTG